MGATTGGIYTGDTGGGSKSNEMLNANRKLENENRELRAKLQHEINSRKELVRSQLMTEKCIRMLQDEMENLRENNRFLREQLEDTSQMEVCLPSSYGSQRRYTL